MKYFGEKAAGLFITLVLGNHVQFSTSSSKEDDQITNLPGLTFELNFKQYSGYLKATETHFLHYWLVESQSNPSTDPLILWLNGGPGCSSLTGLLFENGPLHTNQDNSTLYENVFSWNKFANVLYLEAPAGVGFSYASDGNLTSNDIQTAKENYAALKVFLNRFPEYKGRDFYITGESYAGVYIPTLTMLVVTGMNQKPPDFLAPLKGIAIGNGILSQTKQDDSVIDFLYFHGLIGDKFWRDIKAECCPSSCAATCKFSEEASKLNKTKCLNMGMINVDSTDALAGFRCWGQNAETQYLNIPSVRSALHIRDTLKNVDWIQCNSELNVAYKKEFTEMEKFFEFIIANSNDVRILIYNGDVDMVCNFLMAEWFITNLTGSVNPPLRETQKRQAWLFRTQIAGYVKRYDRIDLLTVKGAGHFVPTSRAGPALQMIANFVWNKPYSDPTNINVDPKPLINEGRGRLCTSATGIIVIWLLIMQFITCWCAMAY